MRNGKDYLAALELENLLLTMAVGDFADDARSDADLFVHDRVGVLRLRMFRAGTSAAYVIVHGQDAVSVRRVHDLPRGARHAPDWNTAVDKMLEHHKDLCRQSMRGAKR
jgi:hypothetical protein